MNSKINLLCVDYKSDNIFKKDWESLGLSPTPQVVILKDALDAVASLRQTLPGRLLILAHDSAFLVGTPSITREEFLKSIRDDQTWVGIVSSGPLDGQISDCGHQCNLKTGFPNGANNLRSLSDRFAKLLADILAAKSIDDSVKAWRAFDETNPNEHVIAMSILCQGFLVLSAIPRQNSDSWTVTHDDLSDEVGDSLKQMGWTESQSKWLVSPEVRLLGLSLQVEVDAGEHYIKDEKINFWKEPFQTGSEESWTECLERDLIHEIRAPLDDRIKRLLDCLAKGKFPDPKRPSDVEIVASAYLALTESLESSG